MGYGMKYSLLILGIIILIVIICGCTTTNSNTQKDVLPTDKYVAVYEEYYNNSTLVGNMTYKPANPWILPAPYYDFDYNNSSKSSWNPISGNIVVNDSTKILFGRVVNNSTPTYYGKMGAFVDCVYSLPFSIENGFEITNITRNGTIFAIYNNSSIQLEPGGTWTSPIITGTTMGHYATYDIPTPGGNATYIEWPVRYNTTYTITNKGIYNKTVWNSSYAK